MRMATLFAAGALAFAAFVVVPTAQSIGASAATTAPRVSVHKCAYFWSGRRWRYRWRGRYYNWRVGGRLYHNRFRCGLVRNGWCYR
jgi:hypothetical protein